MQVTTPPENTAQTGEENTESSAPSENLMEETASPQATASPEKTASPEATALPNEDAIPTATPNIESNANADAPTTSLPELDMSADTPVSDLSTTEVDPSFIITEITDEKVYKTFNFKEDEVVPGFRKLNLPDYIAIMNKLGVPGQLDVTWTEQNGKDFNSDVPGTYTYTATFDNEDFVLAEGVPVPTITAVIHELHIHKIDSNFTIQNRIVGIMNDKITYNTTARFYYPTYNPNSVSIKNISWVLESDESVNIEDYDLNTVGKYVYKIKEFRTDTSSDATNKQHQLFNELIATQSITLNVLPFNVQAFINGEGEDVYVDSDLTAPPFPEIDHVQITGLQGVSDEKSTAEWVLEDGKTFSAATAGETFTYTAYSTALEYDRSKYDYYSGEYTGRTHIHYDLPKRKEIGTYTFTIVEPPLGILSVDIARDEVQFIEKGDTSAGVVFPQPINIIAEDVDGDGTIYTGSTPPTITYYDDLNDNDILDAGEPTTKDAIAAFSYANKKHILAYSADAEFIPLESQPQVQYVEIKYYDHTELYEITWDLIKTPIGTTVYDVNTVGKYIYQAKFTGRKIITNDNINHWYAQNSLENNPPSLPDGMAMPQILVEVGDPASLDTLAPAFGDGSYANPYIYYVKVGETVMLDQKFSTANASNSMDKYFAIDNIEWNPKISGVHGKTPGADLVTDLGSSDPFAWVIVLDEAQAPLKTPEEALMETGKFEIDDTTGTLTYKEHTLSATKTAQWLVAEDGKGEINLNVTGLDAHIPTNTDVVLIFDNSYSMVDSATWGNAIKVLKQAGPILFGDDGANPNNVRVSVVPFASATNDTFNFTNNLSDYLAKIGEIEAPERDTRTSYTMGLAHAAAYADTRTVAEKEDRPLQVIFFTDGTPSGAYGATHEFSPNSHSVDDHSLAIFDEVGSSRLAISLTYPWDSFDTGAPVLRKIHNLEDNYAHGYLRLYHENGIDPVYLQIITSLFDSATNVHITDLISEHFTVIQDDPAFAKGIEDGWIEYAVVDGVEQVTFSAKRLTPDQVLNFKIPVQLKATEMATGGLFPTNHDVATDFGADINYVNFLWNIKDMSLSTPFLPYPDDSTPEVTPTPTPTPTPIPPTPTTPPTTAPTPVAPTTPSTSLPQTGDNSNILLWIMLASLSAGAFLFISIKKDRMNNQ